MIEILCLAIASVGVTWFLVWGQLVVIAEYQRGLGE